MVENKRRNSGAQFLVTITTSDPSVSVSRLALVARTPHLSSDTMVASSWGSTAPGDRLCQGEEGMVFLNKTFHCCIMDASSMTCLIPVMPRRKPKHWGKRVGFQKWALFPNCRTRARRDAAPCGKLIRKAHSRAVPTMSVAPHEAPWSLPLFFGVDSQTGQCYVDQMATTTAC